VVTPSRENATVPEYELPEEITLTLAEASKVLLTLYDTRDALSESMADLPDGERLHDEIADAILIVQR
jgi:hypothetical protein